jgi:hypothetical protein
VFRQAARLSPRFVLQETVVAANQIDRPGVPGLGIAVVVVCRQNTVGILLVDVLMRFVVVELEAVAPFVL